MASTSEPSPSPSNMSDSSPYYLHHIHGDSPGTVLVSQPLVGDNYPTQSRSMVMAMSATNKIGFIDGYSNSSPDLYLYTHS